MFALLAIILAADPPPAIQVASEGDHYRVTVDFFRQSQGPEVDKAIEGLAQATCKGRQIDWMEIEFQTVDPDNQLSNDPPIERAYWDYWQRFRCVDRPAGAPQRPQR